jgi:hypothetical protein
VDRSEEHVRDPEDWQRDRRNRKHFDRDGGTVAGC